MLNRQQINANSFSFISRYQVAVSPRSDGEMSDNWMDGISGEANRFRTNSSHKSEDMLCLRTVDQWRQLYYHFSLLRQDENKILTTVVVKRTAALRRQGGKAAYFNYSMPLSVFLLKKPNCISTARITTISCRPRGAVTLSFNRLYLVHVSTDWTFIHVVCNLQREKQRYKLFFLVFPFLSLYFHI